MIDLKIEQINKQIDDRIKKFVPEYLKQSAFKNRKLTDMPTDALQVVPRKFVTLNGPTSLRPTGSITGQYYFDTTINQAINWSGSEWISDQKNLSGVSLSSVVAATNDKVLIQDTSNSDNLRTVTIQDIADLAGGLITKGGSGSHSASGGNITIAHNLGTTPKLVTIYAVSPSVGVYSHGSYDGTTNSCAYWESTGAEGNSTTRIIMLDPSSGTNSLWTCSIDATDITLTAIGDELAFTYHWTAIG